MAGWTGPPKIDPKTYLLVHSSSDLQKVGISEPVASVQDENSLKRHDMPSFSNPEAEIGFIERKIAPAYKYHPPS